MSRFIRHPQVMQECICLRDYMIGELDCIKKSAQQLGHRVGKSCRKCFGGGKYKNKLSEISVVSSVPGECEVKRKTSPL